MKMKRFFSMVMALIVALGLVSCGSASYNSSYYGDKDNSIVGAPAEAAGAEVSDEYDNAWISEEESLGMNTSGGSGTSEYSVSTERKLIYTGNVELYTTDFDTAVNTVVQMVTEAGGYIGSQQIYGYSEDSRSGGYTVRIPSENFSSFLNQVSTSEVYKLVYQSTNVDDVSDSYYDLENRLETKKIMLNRLNDLLSKAENMEDILTIESRISDVEYEIEYMSGDLKHLDNQVAYSTLYIELNEVSDVVEEMKPGLGQRIVRGFQESWSNFVEGLGDLIVYIASHIFGLVIFAVFIVVTILVTRRVRRKKSVKMDRVIPENNEEK